jgi:4-hydroxybenzoate polyprenyltransferase
MLKDILISMRPKQWYKNLVLFIGIIFSLNLFHIELWIDAISGFAIFCLLSGSIYIINDYMDIDKDRKHPKKRNRPLPSGRLNKNHALGFAMVFIAISLGWAYLINLQFLTASISYLVLIVIYSLFLKEIIIVDILVLSTGFVIRAIAGCLAVGVLVSPWLIICTFLMALFLAIGKRRHELVLLKGDAGGHRKILEGYSLPMLDQMTSITTTSLIMSYTLYTFFANNIYLMATIPFAFYGLFRYMFLIDSKGMGGEPEMLFLDKGMVLAMILWVGIVVWVLYLNTWPLA